MAQKPSDRLLDGSITGADVNVAAGSRARRDALSRRVGQGALAAAVRELRSQRRAGGARRSIGWRA